MLHENQVHRVAVIGTGVIGASWAAFFLARGFDVLATSPERNAEINLRSFIKLVWPDLSRLGLDSKASIDRLTFTTDIEQAVRDADWIQENVPEKNELKREIFTKIDGIAPPHVVLASSSSGLQMSSIQAKCRHPERCIIAHPFNPVHLIPLVEVVGGEKTSEEVIQRAMTFYSELGKKPIHLRKEVKGHVANRLQAALWREAIHLVREGVVNAADLDAAVCWGPGLRWSVMGPNLLFHLGGGSGGIRNFLDHLGESLAEWWTDLGDIELSPPVANSIVESVLEEVGGRSTDALRRERDKALVGILLLKIRQELISTSSQELSCDKGFGGKK